MIPVMIYNHEPKLTTLWAGGTPHQIPARGSLVVDNTFADEWLELAKAEGLNWSKLPPPPDAAAVQALVAQLRAELGQAGPVVPLSIFDQRNLLALDKSVLVQIATVTNAGEFTALSIKQDIVRALLSVAASSIGRTPDYSSGEVGSIPAAATNPPTETLTPTTPPAPGQVAVTERSEPVEVPQEVTE